MEWAESVGDIPAEYNAMVNYYDFKSPKAVHFTDGGPWHNIHDNILYSNEWKQIYKKLQKEKRLILVGNSVEILQYQYGDYIESFDTVVRFGRGMPYDYPSSLGSRTDIWVTGFLRMNCAKFFNCVNLLNRSRIHMDEPPKDNLPEGVEFIEMFSDEEIVDIHTTMGVLPNEPVGWRPSQGFVGSIILFKKV